MIERLKSVAIARSYLKTPYRLRGRIKGVGLDCATLLIAYLLEIGAATEGDFLDFGLYSGDWFCNSSSERYLFGLMRYAKKTMEGICRGTVDAKPGSIILFRVAKSKVFNHGGIITAWPFMVHAADPCVKEADATKYWVTEHCQMAIFDPWEKS